MKPEVGMQIYIPSSYHISRGSDDVEGGLATISEVRIGISGGQEVSFVYVKEVPGPSYNWDQVLEAEQEQLKKEYGKRKAHPSPDEDRPWIEDGDIVNGKVYHGKDIW